MGKWRPRKKAEQLYLGWEMGQVVGTGGRGSSGTTGKWDEWPATLGFSAGLREEATGDNSSWHLPLSRGVRVCVCACVCVC